VLSVVKLQGKWPSQLNVSLVSLQWPFYTGVFAIAVCSCCLTGPEMVTGCCCTPSLWSARRMFNDSLPATSVRYADKVSVLTDRHVLVISRRFDYCRSVLAALLGTTRRDRHCVHPLYCSVYITPRLLHVQLTLYKIRSDKITSLLIKHVISTIIKHKINYTK